MKLTRAKLEELCADLVERLDGCLAALARTQVSARATSTT